jgi:lysine decarboxylase
MQSPTYYGDCTRVEDASALTRRAGIPLLVDEAHGAHFGFHPAYPASALEDGADAVVHGMHKSLPALTGAACLHAANDALSRKLWKALDLLTTTSPSWVLMASLDWARAWATSVAGYEGLEKACQRSNRFAKLVAGIKGIHIGEGKKGLHDPLKSVILLDRVSLSGYEVDRLLRTRFGIQVELAGVNHILAMMSPFSGSGDEYRLARALDSIAREHRGRPPKVKFTPPPSPEVVLTPRQAMGRQVRSVSWQEAEGAVSGETLTVYPPGVPCVVPGETITSEILDYLQGAQGAGAGIQGPEDRTLTRINIIDV